MNKKKIAKSLEDRVINWTKPGGAPAQFGVCRDSGERVDDCEVTYRPYCTLFDMWGGENEFAVFMACGQDGTVTVLLVSAAVDSIDVETQKWQTKRPAEWGKKRGVIADEVSALIAAHCDDATRALVRLCLTASWSDLDG